MTMEVKKYLSSITIGLRFGPSFSICDNLGTIADQILDEEGSFFNKKVFPNIASLPLAIRLENPKTGDYLILSQQDLILNCNFDNAAVKPNSEVNPKFKVDDMNDIHKNFWQLLETLQKYDFDRIQRLGYVNRYVFDTNELTKSVTGALIGWTIDGVSDMTLRFSKRYPVQEALSKKNINNYHNVIYTIVKKADRDDLTIMLDYQEFYEPSLAGTREVKHAAFMSDMDLYNKETFPGWLSKLTLKDKQVG